MVKKLVGLDIETHDPCLKDSGWSWKYNEGYILNTALYYEDADEVKVVAGLHNGNCPFTETERAKGNEEIRSLLTSPDVILLGANIMYDTGWLLYEYGMTVYDVKCSFIDVLQAEHILDEFTNCSLESVCQKYLKVGKTKDRAAEWVRENVSKTGDFRKHLKDVPWEILSEYVAGDAKLPVKVWRKQLTLLKEQDLIKRVKLEFDCILPTLSLTVNGMPLDVKQKRRNHEYINSVIETLSSQFKAKYSFPSFRVTAPRDIAKFCDTRSIPYNVRFTLKGEGGFPYKSDTERKDRGCMKAKKLVSSFRFVKSEPVAFVPAKLAERTRVILEENGFDFIMSPNVDKSFLEEKGAVYPEIRLIADWKKAVSINSKFLGEKYDRYVTKNNRGEDCVRAQYKITDTVTFRYSSTSPNCQQVAGKGSLSVLGRDGEVKEISLPSITRKLFKAGKGCVFGKIDYGQIEYRLICNIACGKAGEEVRQQYRRNPKLDFHQYVVDLTGLSRKYAKNMSFGVSFGLGEKSMAATFGWTQEQTREITEKYHEHMPFVRPTLALVGDIAKERGYIKTVLGSRARLHNPNKSYTMLNRYTQGSGAECLKSAMVEAYRTGLWERLKPANTVHDELNFPYLEPTERCMEDFYRMAYTMRTAVESLRVPLEAEIELGEDWASCRTVGEWLSLRDSGSEGWQGLSAELRRAVEICEGLVLKGADKDEYFS